METEVIQKKVRKVAKKVDNFAEEIAKAEEQACLLASKKVKPYLIGASVASFAAGFLLGLTF